MRDWLVVKISLLGWYTNIPTNYAQHIIKSF